MFTEIKTYYTADQIKQIDELRKPLRQTRRAFMQNENNKMLKRKEAK